MNALILVRTSLRVLYKHAVRSVLTLLGIMIGIAAIIVTFSIGRGAEERVRGQIMSMGQGAMYIIPGTLTEQHAHTKLPKLGVKDLKAIERQSEGVMAISRGHQSLNTIKYNGTMLKNEVWGYDANMLDILNTKLKSGSFFTADEVRKRERVAVLGYETARKLFGDKEPVRNIIRIDNNPFVVVGVLDKIDSSWGPHDPNERVVVPFTVGDKYFRIPQLAEGDLGFIAVKIDDESRDSGLSMRQIKRTLRATHRLDAKEPDNFTIFDEKSILDAASKATAAIKLFGLLAASISLLVGGIGIMNIMLVSVSERTREIGIRMALGATQGLIRRQFLIEAATLSAFGGVLGILLGIGMQYMLSRATTLPGVVEPIPLIVSFLVTIMTGIFFGYYPAHKASLLNPVEALLNK